MQHQIEETLKTIEHGRYAEALLLLNSAERPTLEHEALRLLMELETSEPLPVYKRARELLTKCSSKRDRVLCLLAMGRAAAIGGLIEEGCSHLRLAVKLAINCSDQKLLAGAQVRLAKTLMRYVGIELALPELPRVRRYAYLAGDSRCIADFHCLVAEVHMRQGRLVIASKHLAIAESLTTDASDVIMNAQLYRLRGCVSVLASEPQSGLDAIRNAVSLLQQSGNRYSLRASLSTLAETHLMLGKFDEAARTLRQTLALSGSRASSLITLATMMEVALVSGDAVEAKRLETSIQTLGDFPRDDYGWLWYVTSQAKLLLQERKFEEAIALLRIHWEPAVRTFDHRLISRFRLIQCEALMRAVPEGGAAQLAAAVDAIGAITLENSIHVNRLASIVSSKTPNSFARRAQRIRNIALSVETRTYPLRPSFDLVGTTSDLLHSVAALFSTPVHAELLAHETAALLHASGASDDIRIAAADQQPPADPPRDREGSAERVDIDIHDQTGLRYVVSTRPQPDPDAWLSIMAVQALVRSAVALSESRLRDRLEPSLWPDALMDEQSGMIVAAASMNELLNVTRRVATSNVTVLFAGETGTGKELLARALHDASPRRDKPFIPFNCTAVPRDLLDSQLFGYRRGAFTGAQEAFQGIVRAAAGGTLFLDEIGEMPLDVQPKLLRFLESGEIHPLGEPRPLAADVRVVAATNANLEQLVADGRFREDLFYRLNVVRLQVPPLRERREEIPFLAQHFIETFGQECRKTGLRLSEETMEYLVLYKWPGNVRQLANELRRMVALAESGAVLMPEHLSQPIATSRRTIPASQRDTAPTEFVVRMDQPLSAAMEHLERSMIQYAMTIAEGRQEDAAQLLGLSRKGLYLKRARLKMASATMPEDDEDEDEKGE
jgi:DNA-binding NtrC family response regulator/tetratricopeptide (TPR) repeat protein